MQVLEIVPDVLLAHVVSLLECYYPTSEDKVVETVLHVLFENPDYRKADTKGKRKRDKSQALHLGGSRTWWNSSLGGTKVGRHMLSRVFRPRLSARTCSDGGQASGECLRVHSSLLTTNL